MKALLASMKFPSIILSAGTGLGMLILAAANTGSPGGAWLLPGGLAAWCLAWLISVLPIR